MNENKTDGMGYGVPNDEEDLKLQARYYAHAALRALNKAFSLKHIADNLGLSQDEIRMRVRRLRRATRRESIKLLASQLDDPQKIFYHLPAENYLCNLIIGNFINIYLALMSPTAIGRTGRRLPNSVLMGKRLKKNG